MSPITTLKRIICGKGEASSVRDDGVAIGTGYRLDSASPSGYILPEKIILADAWRKGHLWCFGTTRVGKTRIIENMISRDIHRGNSVVIIDPKGDQELFAKTVETAREAGRLDEMMFISPVFPEYSMTVDPLAHYYIPEELVAHIISGVQVGREPFFYNVAYEISIAIVQALLLTNGRQGPSFNLTDIKNCMSKSELERLAGRVAEADSPDARQLYTDMRKIIDSPQDYYGKVSSSLRVALMELTTGHIGKIIGRERHNLFIERLEKGERVIMLVHLGSLMIRKAAYTLGKVILSMIQSFVGRVFSSGRTVSPPLSLYIDEAHNVLYFMIDDLFAKAGGADIWVHGFVQSVSQLYSSIGRDYANTVLDNTNTKIFMKVPDYETAQYAASHFGWKRRYSGVFGADGGITMREEETECLKPEDILSLGEREFYLMTYSGLYRGESSRVDPARIRIQLPRISSGTSAAAPE
ncbi:MAG TPA: TraM recognition domain-containing protein [Syntrophales bacterium]|nr:TraM recognition domain-containing protein [Syntrophales bacterium]